MHFSYHCAIIIVPIYTEVIYIRYSLTVDDYAKAEAFIKKIKPLLMTGDFSIELTEKNQYFDRKFSLTDQQKREILKALTADDCYQLEPNNNPRYKTSEVYKFFKAVDLIVFGEYESTTLYIKMYIRESKTYDMVIVISFHEEGMHDI